MTSFAYVFYTCRVNASIILALINAMAPRMQDLFDFGMDLVMALMRPFIEMQRIETTTKI